MIGNIIGAGDEIRAKDYARKYLTLGAIGAAAFGLVMYSLARPLLSFYDVSPGTIENTLRIISVMALSMPLRTLNFIILIGILRAGGDTRVAFLIDAGSIWCIGVPLALLGAFVLNLPVYWVYTMVMVDELVKMIVGLYRVFSGRWINQLTSPA